MLTGSPFAAKKRRFIGQTQCILPEKPLAPQRIIGRCAKQTILQAVYESAATFST
jgi:hypothetical protein